MIEAQYMLYGSIIGVIIAYVMERVYRQKLIASLDLIANAAERLMEQKEVLEARIRELENPSPPS